MKAHWQYLKYLLRHKWFVLVAGTELHVSLWQLLTHDWSKFLPREWFPYVNYFYGTKDDGHSLGRGGYFHKAGVDLAFHRAWNHHQKRQPHHWQYWVLVKDDGSTVALPMPDKYLREMVADWKGAGRARGKPDTKAWYRKNRHKLKLHPDTQYYVEALLGVDE